VLEPYNADSDTNISEECPAATFSTEETASKMMLKVAG
jgi:hypothetical protein